MFGRLLKISQHSPVFSNQTSKISRSLNFKSSYEISRKNRQRKIAYENIQIVKKLTETKPFLEKKLLDREYLEYKKYKKRLIKINPIETDKNPEVVKQQPIG